jgi:hypothetical protein
MYGTGVLAATSENDPRNAVGLVKFAYDEIWFEGDVDGNGSVDVVNYKLQPDGTGACPCWISRSQNNKSAAAPLAQLINYRTGLEEVVNSGGANGGATGVGAYSIKGATPTGAANDVVYAMYKNANVFTAYG